MQAQGKKSKTQSLSPANIHYVVNKGKENDIPTCMNTSQFKDQLKHPEPRPLYFDSDDDNASMFDYTVSYVIYLCYYFRKKYWCSK